jgi:hypothetical protein
LSAELLLPGVWLGVWLLVWLLLVGDGIGCALVTVLPIVPVKADPKSLLTLNVAFSTQLSGVNGPGPQKKGVACDGSALMLYENAQEIVYLMVAGEQELSHMVQWRELQLTFPELKHCIPIWRCYRFQSSSSGRPGAS